MRQLFITLSILFFCNFAQAQLDQATCKEILSGYDKSNKDFGKMNIATLDFTRHNKKFDINWLTDFRFNFMEKVLDIEYTSESGVFHTYIPYDKIIKINSSKVGLDIIIEG